MVVLEGPDNSGKGTQISNIYKLIARQGIVPFWMHWANFGIADRNACVDFSERAYRDMFFHCRQISLNGAVPILDRAHLGEWVYGKIYRDYDANFIWDIEKYFDAGSSVWFSTIKLITFIDEPENLIKREDGLSFSTDLTKKAFEIGRFKEAHEMSRIKNKLLLNIDGLNKEEVWEEVQKFLQLWEV